MVRAHREKQAAKGQELKKFSKNSAIHLMLAVNVQLV